jgi:AcrR family transcriptional regulator
VRAATLEAAVAELAASGLAELSLENVARRAGVHKSTLYRRWGNREQLILDVLRAQAARRVRVPDTGSLRADLIELAGAAAATAASPQVQPIIRAVIAELPHDAAIARAAGQFWSERMRLDGAIIERAIARGELAPDTDPPSAIEAVLAPLHLRLLISGQAATELQVASAVDLVVAGLTAGAWAARSTTGRGPSRRRVASAASAKQSSETGGRLRRTA